MKKIIFSLIILLISGPAFATTYYATASGGGGAASCVDSGANVCTLARAVVVASTGTNTIQCAAGTYNITTELSLGSGNTGANLTFTCDTTDGCTWGSDGSTAVVDIETTMVSGTVTFDDITMTDTSTDYIIRNQSPEVNVVFQNGSCTNTDASQGQCIYTQMDTTNAVSLVTGNDTSTGLRTGATTNVKIAQQITVGGSNITVNKLGLLLKKIGTGWSYASGDTLTVTIETNSAGAPSGTPVTNGTSNTILAFDVANQNPEYSFFTFASNVSLTASTVYWIVLQGSYTASSSNYIEWYADSTSGGYAGGDSSTYNGTTWTGSAAGFDYLFHLDRDHTRTLTVTNSTVNTRSSNFLLSWSDTVTITGNNLTSTASGILNLVNTGQITAADVSYQRVTFENNVVSNTTNLSLMITAGVNAVAKTYIGALIIKGNSGTVNGISKPAVYVKKLFMKDNDLDIQYTGNTPFQLGFEVDGSDPEGVNYQPFDQIVIEDNIFDFTGNSHNHLMLFGLGAEDGAFINNRIIATYGSGTSSGGWGIVVKADRWFFYGNRYYGPGPAIYITSNNNKVFRNTLETYDATASNAPILLRNHQDSIYGGRKGIPFFNYIRDNILISNGSSYPAIQSCDTNTCGSGASTFGAGRTSEYWSNRIDNNVYYARDKAGMYTIGAGANTVSRTVSDGISTVRTDWASSTYTDKNSISQYNDDGNSAIGDPGVSGASSGNFRTSSSLVKNKGSAENNYIGGYQGKGSKKWLGRVAPRA